MTFSLPKSDSNIHRGDDLRLGFPIAVDRPVKVENTCLESAGQDRAGLPPQSIDDSTVFNRS